MAHNITTSIRLPAPLRAKLEKVSHAMHRGKNWIIIHALESYLEKQPVTLLALEARRQSLLACEADKKEDEMWEDNGDTTGWK